MRRVNLLVYSLSLHRHSYIVFILAFASSIHNKQKRYRGNATSFSAASSSRLETMVGGVLVRVSVFRVGVGVSGATIMSDRALVHRIRGFLTC